MADLINEPAGPAAGSETPSVEAERRSYRTTIALIEAALADCPADPASLEAEEV